jgi:hypothetical protein
MNIAATDETSTVSVSGPVRFVPVLKGYTKASLEAMNLDCGNSRFECGFLLFIEEHFDEQPHVPEVMVEVIPVNATNQVNHSRIQRLACQYQFSSAIIARIAWMIEIERDGETTPLTRDGDNIIVIRQNGRWVEFRVCRHDSVDCFDWSIEVEHNGSLRCNRGDQFLVFSSK